MADLFADITEVNQVTLPISDRDVLNRRRSINAVGALDELHLADRRAGLWTSQAET